MKLAIIGTRGIPNYYGGFEQFAQYLSSELVRRGHDVFVYNSHNHPYQKKEWNGVKIIHCQDPENFLGAFGQFIYDFNCILNSRRKNYDIILQLGYTSSSIWNWLLPKKSLIITNMDGLEWKRDKYSMMTKLFLRFAERLAIKYSDHIIADSISIQSYLRQKYQKQSKYIPYGAEVPVSFSKNVLSDLSLDKYKYHLIIARIEPENNIETILKGFTKTNLKEKLIIVGRTNNRFGKYLKNKYKDNRLVFLEFISDKSILNSLRFFSKVYFHGHSVGGTNPSLLEAMANSCVICAHNNEFNSAILGDDAFYFDTFKDISLILERNNQHDREKFTNMNLNKIKDKYSWQFVITEYESTMIDLLNN